MVVNRALVEIKFLFTVICLFGLIRLQAQAFSVHLDKPYYIAGDPLQYQLYPHQSITRDSMMACAELYASNGTLIFQHHHRITGDQAGGHYLLPYSFKEGLYEFISYAVWDHRTRDTCNIIFSRTLVPVYNDIEQSPDQTIAQDWQLFGKNKSPVLDSTATKLKPRSIHSMILDLSAQIPEASGGQYSVSIHQFYPDLPSFNANYTPTIPVTPNDQYVYRKNLFLDGILTDPENHKPVTEKYLSLYWPFTGSFRRIQSKEGRLKTPLNDIYGQENFQILSLNPNQRYPLEWRPVRYGDLLKNNLPNSPVLNRNPVMQYILSQEAKKRMVDELFETDLTRTRATLLPKPDSVKKYRADKQYLITDFQDMESLEEFIKEVMLDCYITDQINNKKSLRLRNKDINSLYRWPAWYMLDGYFRGDEDVMLNLNIARIKTLELYNKKQTIANQFDPLMAYSGIFSLSTYLQDQEPLHVYSLNGWYHSLLSNTPLQTPAVNKPDLTNNLGWYPSVKTDEKGFVSLTIQTSDLTGTFEIDVKGKNANGEFVSATFFIRVE